MIYTCKPSKVSIYVNKYPYKTIAQVKEETGCDAIINGGLYDMSTYKPNCHLKVDGKVLATDPYNYFGYGWNANELPALVADYSKLDNYICCACLVRNGTAEKLIYDSGVSGSRPRTAIGTFSDGRIWLYADTARKTPEQLRDLALAEGVKDALMLDGGGSVQCVFPEGNIKSERKVQNYICVWNGEETVKEPIKDKVYRVQVGAFRIKAFAQNMLNKLKKDGFSDAYIVEANGIYRVQIGAFRIRSYAEALKDKVTSSGYTAIIAIA